MDGRRLARGVAVGSTAGLCLLVLGVAVVAVVAEFHATWRWYFRMEQVMAAAAPVTVALLVAFLAGWFGLVATTPAD